MLRFASPSTVKANGRRAMSTSSLLRLDLGRLILLLAIASALLTLANLFHASYRVQRQLLIDSTLEANRVYAAKLADSTHQFLLAAQRQLAYSAVRLSGRFDDADALHDEVQRLKQQAETFNSTFVVGADSRLRAVYPSNLALGTLLTAAGTREALRERRPLMSLPFVSVTGRLIIMLSQPIYAPDGSYLGFLGGSLYLKEKSALHTLLGEHYYRDGSYLYVVDRQRSLVYHRDPERVGEVIKGNPAIDAVVRGEAGSMRLTNSWGIDMLAGYAPLGTSGWGVVAQRPTEMTLAGLDGLMLTTLRNAIPVTLISLLGIWWLARLISRPLWQLANTARNMDSQTASGDIRSVRAWYFEAAQLKRAMLTGLTLLQQKIGKLNLDTLTDPLTGLFNRRGLQMTLERWQDSERPFAVVALDIDHFKRINDNHGHNVGDQAIRHMAQLMRDTSRGNDVLCRNGGEEFLMLLPEASLDAARMVAERLRARMESSLTPGVGLATVSLGVAHWPASDRDIDTVLKMADQALYAAKQQGRNRVMVAAAGGAR